jgi:NDP-sugar pyrophosphorylase family protein
VLSSLILAAGLGTRLDPLTRFIAKPAVPLGDSTLIEHVLSWLHRQSVRDVIVNLHHHPASISSVLGDGRHLDLTVRYSWEQPVLGSAGGPRRALSLLGSDPFLIVNGDTLCDFDLGPMLDAHVSTQADVTMAVVPNPKPNHYNGILLGEDDRVIGFIPRGHSEPSWHFVGVQIAHRRVFEGLVDGVPSETVAGVYRQMIAGAPGCIRGWKVNTSFLDVGTPRDYLAAALQQPQAVRAGQIAASARLTRSVVWPGVTIEDDVVLEDCIIAGPMRVPRGLEAHTGVLIPAAWARPGDRMRRHDEVAIYPLDIGHASA